MVKPPLDRLKPGVYVTLEGKGFMTWVKAKDGSYTAWMQGCIMYDHLKANRSKYLQLSRSDPNKNEGK